MSLADEMLTQGEREQAAYHVLWHLGDPRGLIPGGFTEKILDAWTSADLENQRRLRTAFPALGIAVQRALEGGADAVAAWGGIKDRPAAASVQPEGIIASPEAVAQDIDGRTVTVKFTADNDDRLWLEIDGGGDAYAIAIITLADLQRLVATLTAYPRPQ